MAKVITDEQNYYDIADAIRSKLEVETLYLPSEMAAAIETIETGIELTSEDEGKVVVEDEGVYVLTEQTSQTITLNGTYDTTTINELIANISGGGTARNILNGNSVPASGIGSDGDIYLYLGSNIVTMQAYNITDIDISVTNGVVTIVGTTAGIDTSDGTFSGVTLKTGINLVRISVTSYQNGVQYGTCSSSASLPTVVSTGSGRGSYSSDTGGYDFSKNTDDYYFACAYSNGVGNEVRIEVTSNDQSRQFDADTTSINNVYLKVNGTWVLIEGQDISDVNTNANLIEKAVTSNGTYDPTDDDAEGYSIVTVDVPQSGGGGDVTLAITGYYSGMSASSLYSGQIPERAVGAQSNSWCGFNSKAQNWWMIELNEPMQVNTVKFANYYTAGGTWYSDSVTFQGGDGTTWTDLLTVSGLEQSNEQREYTIQDPDEYTYYRFVCNNTTATSYYTGIGKVQLFT